MVWTERYTRHFPAVLAHSYGSSRRWYYPLWEKRKQRLREAHLSHHRLVRRRLRCQADLMTPKGSCHTKFKYRTISKWLNMLEAHTPWPRHRTAGRSLTDAECSLTQENKWSPRGSPEAPKGNHSLQTKSYQPQRTHEIKLWKFNLLRFL